MANYRPQCAQEEELERGTPEAAHVGLISVILQLSLWADGEDKFLEGVPHARVAGFEAMSAGSRKSWFRFAAELESAGASSRMDEIDLRGRFSRRFFRFGASLPAAVAGVSPH